MNQKRKIFPFWRAKTTTAWRVVFFLSLLLVCFFGFQAAYAAEKPVVLGQVFNDLNVNESMDIGEVGLSGWRIKAFQGGKIVQSVISDSNGHYEMNLLAPGNYSLEIEEKPGWESVSQRAILISVGKDSVINQNFGLYQTINQTSGWAPIIKISSIEVESISQTSAKITWFSSHLTSAQIIYGFSALDSQTMSISEIDFGYDYSSAVDFKGKTYHSVVLNNLKPGSHYYFRVVSYPDINQWRHANYLVSNEFGFKTQESDSQNIGLKGDNSEVEKPLVKNNIPANSYPGRVLSVELDDSESAQLIAESENNSLTPEVKEDKPALSNCFWSIIILLVLNLLALLAVWYIGDKRNIDSEKKIWWVNLILIVVPTILAFPECWLNFWLVLTLLLSLIYLFIRRKDLIVAIHQKEKTPKDPQVK